MRFSRFTRSFLVGAALLSAVVVTAQIQTQNRALAQFSGAPNDKTNPILQLPPPPAVRSGKIASPAPKLPAKNAAAPRVTVSPQAVAAPKPTPTSLPTLKPRFIGQQPIRVGLSTQGGPIQIYVPGGATLFDLNQPGHALSLPPSAHIEMRFGVDAIAKPFRGPISVGISGAVSSGWQRVYIAVNGEPARVATSGADPKYGRPYRGDLEIFPQKLGEPVKRKGPLALVNVVPLEAYLRGVVPWEMSPDAPLEALKAQAICARTKTLDFVRTKRFAAGDFEICDYDACQGYPGTENEKPATTKAVEATKGLAIYHNHRPIDAVYSTNSGGITANARDVWPNGAPIPYLQSVPDFAPDSPLGKLWKSGMTEARWAQFCAGDFASFAKPDGIAPQSYEARKYRWNQQISVETASQAFVSDGISRVLKLEIMERTLSGRIKRLRVTGIDAARFKAMPTPLPNPTAGNVSTPTSEVPAADVLVPTKTVDLVGDGKIRAMFSKRLGSTTALASSLFTISPLTDPGGQVSGWNFQGAGWGHGVGMCQRGAQNHAREGWDARKILNWYYRGVEIR